MKVFGLIVLLIAVVLSFEYHYYNGEGCSDEPFKTFNFETKKCYGYTTGRSGETNCEKLKSCIKNASTLAVAFGCNNPGSFQSSVVFFPAGKSGYTINFYNRANCTGTPTESTRGSAKFSCSPTPVGNTACLSQSSVDSLHSLLSVIF